ncbi:hypothetical protein [Marinigracilibium pacificum]|uniref:Lipoprotein n=1 Tax=Marinigracilibium pacificum TaxID=2729599 RepID=A0A848J258_9BACT|nr:hypothetical protein [Marinigracilibium pacificum]NMM48564.1 hypothetical protein [Marinigracilibium pacificum]
MKNLFLLTTSILIFFSCNDNSFTKEEEEANLINLYERIETLAYSVTCDDNSSWLITPIGAKACGGPTHYLPYSTEIDTAYFLNLVNQYNKLQADFNVKHRIYSDCSTPISPSGVFCKDAKPEFSY